MNNQKNKAGQWQEIIIDFLSDKHETDFLTYLKKEIRDLNSVYEKESYLNSEQIKELFRKRNQDPDFQKESDFIIQSQIEELSKFPEKPLAVDFISLKMNIQKKKVELDEKFSANIWVDWAAKNSSSVEFATHVPKLTHSKISAPSIVDQISSQKKSYLTTSSLKEPIIDGAVKGNQFSPIYQFLELNLGSEKLVSALSDPENSILSKFTEDETQLLEWNNSFSKILTSQSPSADSHLKQVYFPLDQNIDRYHLLCNVASSSQAHEIHNQVNRNQKGGADSRKKNKFSSEKLLFFPNRAVLSVTGSNHGNASQLNARRRGRLTLFSAAPPIWKTTSVNPPIYRTSFYYALDSNREITRTIDYLRDFLVRFESAQLSIRNPQRRRWVEEWLENIIDEIFFYITTIQSLPSDWSNLPEIRLRKNHQILLDLGRKDEEFVTIRNTPLWQEELAIDFADWLNHRLNRGEKKLAATDEHSKIWKSIFKKELTEFLVLSNQLPPLEVK